VSREKERAMSLPTDVRPIACTLYFLPVTNRVPLKFGPETVTQVTCARTCLTVADRSGRRALGWGETPLSVQWAWPGGLPVDARLAAMKDFCVQLAEAWAGFDSFGHALEVGYEFLAQALPPLLRAFNQRREQPMPHLAALICCSVFDQALHDAYGNLHGVDIYRMYNAQFLSRDLAEFLEPADGGPTDFAGRYPQDYLVAEAPRRLRAWHLVGGVDPLEPSDLTGKEPHDGYPVLLRDWIDADGLKCLKVKLRGTDAMWDCERLVHVGRIAIEKNVEWLSADFNCTVTDPVYVNAILDRLRAEQPRVWEMILYVEQPFPYDLEAHRIDVHAVSTRKPLFLDESAHDWKFIRLGRSLGWSGVALKTCKTQTGAILSLCWAKAHAMPLMVQDLTNPMLAQIPHLRLAAHAGTIMGVETNCMQFYPEASLVEAEVHPGLYQRREGCIHLASLSGPGFSYRIESIKRQLPDAAARFE
jgi:L-alanine-DL-glutamate epimerase-like enolase superfamily enzyme